MLPRSNPDSAVPNDTAELAHKLFDRDQGYMLLRDRLGILYQDEAFAPLFSTQGKPAVSPALLAVVLVLQYMEGLSDRQAVHQLRARIDWKYLLGLPLDYIGFDASVLSEFRARLVNGNQESYLLTRFLDICREAKLLRERGKQRTDSTHVLAAVRQLNRLELVAETMRHALNTLAAVVPDWLQDQVPEEWFDRYGQRIEEYRLPTSETKRHTLGLTIGQDGHNLWHLLHQSDAPEWLVSIPAVETLRQVWIQQFYLEDEEIHWRKSNNSPPGERLIQSPYDIEARYSRKRQMSWIGYKVHITESCEAEKPHLIVDVQTTTSTQPDNTVLPQIYAALDTQQLLPSEHVLDTGYGSARNRLLAAEQQVDCIIPLDKDSSWQARQPDAFDLTHFAIDWVAQKVTCPRGVVSTIWSESTDRLHPVIHIRFPKKSCDTCSVRNQCTKALRHGRSLKLRSQKEHQILRAARKREKTPAFKDSYRVRAGIEGTVSQGTRSFGLRSTRYKGRNKTHLQQLVTAVGINLVRLANWFAGVPLSKTRTSRFAALQPAS